MGTSSRIKITSHFFKILLIASRSLKSKSISLCSIRQILRRKSWIMIKLKMMVRLKMLWCKWIKKWALWCRTQSTHKWEGPQRWFLSWITRWTCWTSFSSNRTWIRKTKWWLNNIRSSNKRRFKLQLWTSCTNKQEDRKVKLKISCRKRSTAYQKSSMK